MKTFELKGSKEKVKIGDLIYKKNDDNSLTIIKVTDNNIDKLIQQGIIEEKKSLQISYCDIKESLSSRCNIHIEDIDHLLYTIKKVGKSLLASLLLKEAAIQLDKQYVGHIKDCDYVYIISKVDWSIKKLPTHILNNDSLKNIAAFRNEEDAILAKKTVAVILSEQFK